MKRTMVLLLLTTLALAESRFITAATSEVGNGQAEAAAKVTASVIEMLQGQCEGKLKNAHVHIGSCQSAGDPYVSCFATGDADCVTPDHDGNQGE
jgi:hypothetical protein